MTAQIMIAGLFVLLIGATVAMAKAVGKAEQKHRQAEANEEAANDQAENWADRTRTGGALARRLRDKAKAKRGRS